MLTVVYLAAPYWHEDAAIRGWRAMTASRAVEAIVARPDGKDLMVYSPLSYGDAIDRHSMTPGNMESYWKRHGIAMLRRCDQLWILQLEGWDQSTGVEAEFNLALRLNMPIEHITPESLGLPATYSTPT